MPNKRIYCSYSEGLTAGVAGICFVVNEKSSMNNDTDLATAFKAAKAGKARVEGPWFRCEHCDLYVMEWNSPGSRHMSPFGNLVCGKCAHEIKVGAFQRKVHEIRQKKSAAQLMAPNLRA